MVDADGRRYLDMYNNVPSIGHGHPRVTTAVARQWRMLNTNLRYLHHSAVELAERLLAQCPASLDTVLFVNSGSEANDLAWRLATHYTGGSGGLCTEFAYHGITAAMAPFSPETLPDGVNETPVERWAPTDAYRGLHTGTEEFTAALDRLDRRGLAPALTILDGVLQSDGVLDLTPSHVQELVRLTHQAGALWVADEVQGGHGRTGEAMWSFERFGIEPDMVTLGKAMGDGQPVGALITRREIAERFSRDTVFFSTFAGNQVSMAAATAVLDVLDDERILPRVRTAGEALRTAVRAATAQDERIGDVRGVGLANGIEIVRDRASKTPDTLTAGRIKDALRDRGVLVGTTGKHANVLKVRPPLAFTEDLVPVFVAALDGVLSRAGLTAPGLRPRRDVPSSRPRSAGAPLVDDLPAGHGQLDASVRDVRGRDVEQVAVDQREVRALADGQASAVLVVVHVRRAGREGRAARPATAAPARAGTARCHGARGRPGSPPPRSPPAGSAVVTDQSLPMASVAPERRRSPNGYCSCARSRPRNGKVSSSICGSICAQ